jgi:hypothetical protein
MAVFQVEMELQWPRQCREDQKTLLVNIPSKCSNRSRLDVSGSGAVMGMLGSRSKSALLGFWGDISGAATAFFDIAHTMKLSNPSFFPPYGPVVKPAGLYLGPSSFFRRAS